MTQSRRAQRAPRRRRSPRRWTLGSTAPGWFRQGWQEQSREVPKPSEPSEKKTDMQRIRRIAYL